MPMDPKLPSNGKPPANANNANISDSSSDAYAAYSTIMGLARDLNTQVAVPEIVLIGNQTKAPLIEAILGFPIPYLENPIKRPIWYSLVNNPECPEPVVTVKRDGVLKPFETDVPVALPTLAEELGKRNDPSAASTPIKVQFEYKNCWNMMFIETVSLGSYKHLKPEELEENILKHARPVHRILVFTEESGDWEKIDTIELAKSLDPKFDRSYFVFSDFEKHLHKFNSSRDLNRFLSSNIVDSHTYFFSQLPSDERTKIPVGLQGKTQLQQAQAQKLRHDLDSLELLQFDKTYERRMGLSQWRSAVLDLTWRRYQDAVPEVLKRLRAFKKNSEEQLVRVRTQLDSMDPPKLRALASNYVMEFLQSIEKLIVGTLEGNPALNGQTLLEEKVQEDAGDWLDSNHRPILFDPAAWNIPYWDSKLYGGQQFERLLSEFKSVADHTKIDEVTLHDIATAAGPNRLTTPSNYAWTASDISQKKTQSALLPLVDQLFKRAIYVLKRLVDIVDRMMENKRKAALRRVGSNANSVPMSTLGRKAADQIGAAINIDDYPYFTHSVKEMYFKFVDQTATECKSKCMDEFYCTRLIYWELQQDGVDLSKYNHASGKDREAIRQAVMTLASKLFDDIKARITKNVLLKCYNFFLIPMQTDLWGEVQSKITTLTDQMLEESFEVTVTKAKLKEDEKHLKDVLEKFKQQEDVFRDAANVFSRPIW